MPVLASIDIGSNTLRLLIAEAEDNKISRLKCEMKITRLAGGISGTGRLNRENMEKSVSVLKDFSRIMREYRVSHVRAVGTSALREAENSKEFTDRVFSEAGIRIDIISGEEEAALMTKGVVFDLPVKNSSLIIDIGGGSTELIFCRHSLPVKIWTIPLGVVKLFDRCIKSDPPSKDDIACLNKETGMALNMPMPEIAGVINEDTMCIGTAGTITTIAAIDMGLEKYDHEKIHGHRISLRRLCDISEKLSGMPLVKRKELRGLEPERADLIIPGIAFTIKVMEMFGFGSLLISDDGLLEGILIELSSGGS